MKVLVGLLGAAQHTLVRALAHVHVVALGDGADRGDLETWSLASRQGKRTWGFPNMHGPWINQGSG